MKCILTVLATVIFLLSPIASIAGYVIHLKDGTKFVTDQYFEEGDQIKFERYGGVIGIKRDRVREIEEMEISLEALGQKEPSPQTETTPAEAETEERKEQSGVPSKAKGAAQEMQPEDREKQNQGLGDKDEEVIDTYLKKFDLYKEEFKSVELMTKEELIGFSKKLDTFKKEVLSKRLGAVFSDHLLEVYAMLDRIEAILNLKGD